MSALAEPTLLATLNKMAATRTTPGIDFINEQPPRRNALSAVAAHTFARVECWCRAGCHPGAIAQPDGRPVSAITRPAEWLLRFHAKEFAQYDGIPTDRVMPLDVRQDAIRSTAPRSDSRTFSRGYRRPGAWRHRRADIKNVDTLRRLAAGRREVRLARNLEL